MIATLTSRRLAASCFTFLLAAIPLALHGSPASAAPALGEREPDIVCKLETANGSNFNGTSIAAGNRIWFNAVVNVKERDGREGIVRFGRSQIRFTANAVQYQIDVPASTITFDPLATQATTDWDDIAQRWRTTVPASYSGNVFLTGVAWNVPVALPGGINPVNWTGVFDTSISGVEFQWKWAAAVYTVMSLDGDELLVKPIDGSQQNPYANSDHAGTPQAFKDFVTGGARGGGGSNWTGSYSGTKRVVCPVRR